MKNIIQNDAKKIKKINLDSINEDKSIINCDENNIAISDDNSVISKYAHLRKYNDDNAVSMICVMNTNYINSSNNDTKPSSLLDKCKKMNEMKGKLFHNEFVVLKIYRLIILIIILFVDYYIVITLKKIVIILLRIWLDFGFGWISHSEKY